MNLERRDSLATLARDGFWMWSNRNAKVFQSLIRQVYLIVTSWLKREGRNKVKPILNRDLRKQSHSHRRGNVESWPSRLRGRAVECQSANLRTSWQFSRAHTPGDLAAEATRHSSKHNHWLWPWTSQRFPDFVRTSKTSPYFLEARNFLEAGKARDVVSETLNALS